MESNSAPFSATGDLPRVLILFDEVYHYVPELAYFKRVARQDAAKKQLQLNDDLRLLEMKTVS